MILSLNEIEATVRKAALGRGWSHGLAVEAGRGAAWLSARGFDGVAAACDALMADPAKAVRTKSAPECVLSDAPVIATGVAACDLLASGATKVRLTGTDAPLFLYGITQATAERYGLGVAILIDGAEFDPNTPPQGPCDAILSKGAMTSPPPGLDPTANAADWAHLHTLAARTYVAATDQSRSGAGAGTTDND